MGMKLPDDVERKVLAAAGEKPAARGRRAPPAVATGGAAGWEVLLVVPCRVVSEMNRRDHWAVRKKRFDAQRRELWRRWRNSPLNCVALVRCLPVVVEFTHVGRRMDDDNLAGAFKALRDGLSRLFQIDDGDERIRWRYAQRPGLPGVEVRIRPAKGGGACTGG